MTYSSDPTKFWWHWLTGCGLGTLLGGVVTQVSSTLLSHLATGFNAETPLVSATFMVATATLEGVIIGVGQWIPLRDRVGHLWVVQTAMGITLGWLCGMAATFFEGSSNPPLEVILLLGAVFGGVLGILVGGLQMRVAATPRWWLWSGLGWSACFVLRAIASDLIPYGPDSFSSVAIGSLGALVGGLALGAVTAGPARTLRARDRIAT